MAKRSAPEVNAGSMADIAFLLLIFFLVTTTIEVDSGIDRMLPPIEEVTPPPVNERNVFSVILNGSDELLVQNERMELKDLKSKALAFIDNGGDGSCDYCKGKRDSGSSDNPRKAVISLKSESGTSYGIYMAVQNELLGAYNQLRDIRSKTLHGKSFQEMEADFKDVNWPGNKDELKSKIEALKKDYPAKLAEIQ